MFWGDMMDKRDRLTIASVLALTEDSQIVETVRVCADEDAGMHLAVS